MRKKKSWLFALGALTALLALLLLLPSAARRQEPAALGEAAGLGETGMLAVNVGKADSLLVWAEGKFYLVDTGAEKSWGALRAALRPWR